jgi:hypothetical protein
MRHVLTKKKDACIIPGLTRSCYDGMEIPLRLLLLVCTQLLHEWSSLLLAHWLACVGGV